MRLAIPSSSPQPTGEELDVGRARGVVAELVGVVRAQAQLLSGMPRSVYQRKRSAHQYSNHFGPFGRHEELHLHLLELARAEDEVAWGDLVAERLAHLGDAERRLLAARLQHVDEVHEDALGRLGPQVGHRALVLDRPTNVLNMRLKPGLGEVGGPAVRALPLDLVLAPALLAVAAVDERVGEGGQVPEASHTRGAMRMAASRPTMSSRSCTIARHHASIRLRFMRTPSGP